ncbi:MAG: transcriptional repressor LexA [Clostridia bacterium]|nr:transcriptional repressor LexA [Clostridia bacterium]
MGKREDAVKNEDNILNYIRKQVEEVGYPPTVREICAAVGLKSTSSVHWYLSRLADKGLISKGDLKTRALKVVGQTMSSEIKDPDMIEVPLVGQVAAGLPILAEQNIEEYVKLPISMVKQNAKQEGTYMLKVKGDSMINVGIYSGDYIIVAKTNTAENGQIVVALIEDEATVKTFYKEKGYVRLQPENDSMDPIIVTDVQIIGKVVGLIRRF